MQFGSLTRLALLSTTLAGCSASTTPLDPLSIPSNPNAAQIVSITGSVAPGLSVPEVIAVYATATRMTAALPSGDCAAWVNHLEGVFGPKTIELHVATAGKGDAVSATIQIDKYLPGKCGWRLREVDAIVMDDATLKRASYRIGYGLDFFQIASAAGSVAPAKPDNKVTFHCSSAGQNFWCSPKIPSAEGVEVMLGPSTKALRFEAERGLGLKP